MVTRIEQAVYQALAENCIDLDQVTARPDGVWVYRLSHDERVSFGLDEGDCSAAEWWTATHWDASDDATTVYEGTELAELARVLARYSGHRAG